MENQQELITKRIETLTRMLESLLELQKRKSKIWTDEQMLEQILELSSQRATLVLELKNIQ